MVSDPVVDAISTFRGLSTAFQGARGGYITPMISVRSVRFLFVDGDHSRAGVEADITLFFPLLNPGSIVVFDDFSEEAIGLVTEADALLARQPTSKAFSYPNTLVLVLNQGVVGIGT